MDLDKPHLLPLLELRVCSRLRRSQLKRRLNSSSKLPVPSAQFTCVLLWELSRPQDSQADSLPYSTRSWRIKQAEEIAVREAESSRKKEETIVKAQNAIDNFYKEYNSKKEKNIATNKSVILTLCGLARGTDHKLAFVSQGGGSQVQRDSNGRPRSRNDLGTYLHSGGAPRFEIENYDKEQAGFGSFQGGTFSIEEGRRFRTWRWRILNSIRQERIERLSCSIEFCL